MGGYMYVSADRPVILLGYRPCQDPVAIKSRFHGKAAAAQEVFPPHSYPAIFCGTGKGSQKKVKGYICTLIYQTLWNNQSGPENKQTKAEKQTKDLYRTDTAHFKLLL